MPGAFGIFDVQGIIRSGARALSFCVINASGPPRSAFKDNWFTSISQLFYYIFAFALVLCLAYLCTKLLAKARNPRHNGKRAGNIQIIDSLALNMQCSLQLVRAGEKYILIGVAKDRASFITEVEAGQLRLPEAEPEKTAGFEVYLRNMMSDNRIAEKINGFLRR